MLYRGLLKRHCLGPHHVTMQATHLNSFSETLAVIFTVLLCSLKHTVALVHKHENHDPGNSTCTVASVFTFTYRLFVSRILNLLFLKKYRLFFSVTSDYILLSHALPFRMGKRLTCLTRAFALGDRLVDKTDGS